jgi:hypothetical protein
MRNVTFMAAMLAGAVCISPVATTAAPLPMLGIAAVKTKLAGVKEVGWRRRYWRYGYRAPYAYYPPAYGYYPPLPMAITLPCIRRIPTIDLIATTSLITLPIELAWGGR